MLIDIFSSFVGTSLKTRLKSKLLLGGAAIAVAVARGSLLLFKNNSILHFPNLFHRLFVLESV